MQHEDDRLISPGALLGEQRFEAFAGPAERSERIAKCYRPVDAGHDTALFQCRAPAKRGFHDPRQAVRFAGGFVVLEGLGFETDRIETGKQVLFADETQVKRLDWLADDLQRIEQCCDGGVFGGAVRAKQR
jgi:hypothetical protein